MYQADRPTARQVNVGSNVGSLVVTVAQVVNHSIYLNIYKCCKYECIAGTYSYTAAARRILAIGS